MPVARGGYPPREWAAARAEMLAVLVEVAASQATITYGNLAARVHAIEFDPRSPLLATMLGEISEEQDALGRGMLSAVVIHQEGDQMPGEGFFALARRLGRRIDDKEQMWVREVGKVHQKYRGLGVPPSPPADTSTGTRFRDETELHRLGYNVTDLNDTGRWEVLKQRAVPTLGLREVVDTIAGLIRTRRLQRFGSYTYQKAIERWESDLRRLKIEYYEGDFPWPSTD